MAVQSVIFIDLEGNVTGLSDDFLDRLTDLGDRTVTRVSNIEFDNERKLWIAIDESGKVIGEHAIRSELINIEREYLNKLIESGEYDTNCTTGDTSLRPGNE